MTKYVCIKDCEVTGMNIHDVKVGDIIDCIHNETTFIELKSEIIIINKELYLMEYGEFPNHFIPLAEYREQQINEILNEDI